VSCDGIQDTRPQTVTCICAPYFKRQFKGSQIMIVCCYPGVDQDGIHLFGSSLCPGFQRDRPRPLFPPLLNEARTLACIPSNDWKGSEPNADQTVQLMHTAGGNDTGI